jgi:putative chitinase
MMILTIETLQKLWPHSDQHIPGLAEGIIAAVPRVVEKYPDFAKPIVMTHAMAQFSHECSAGLEMVENLNYSASGLILTWPTRFDRTNAARYAHSPKMIADIVYGRRMGNAPLPSDDGWRYRGRGLSQLTGRENYASIGKKLGPLIELDLLDDPDLVNNPADALEIAIVDFIACGCVAPAEANDINGVTHHLNGGLIGLPGRKAWFAKWKAALLA